MVWWVKMMMAVFCGMAPSAAATTAAAAVAVAAAAAAAAAATAAATATPPAAPSAPPAASAAGEEAAEGWTSLKIEERFYSLSSRKAQRLAEAAYANTTLLQVAVKTVGVATAAGVR
ncbi:unnamed protein product [Closterium sp. NIES-65]|nr:unnamed protein product [Closterium sp. NIES-65]